MSAETPRDLKEGHLLDKNLSHRGDAAEPPRSTGGKALPRPPGEPEPTTADSLVAKATSVFPD